jgi:phosphopantothenate---cysteine ligase (CTP)
MNCIVTAGPTYENLDKVRRLTNFSTGRLGIELANFLVDRGHDVTLLVGEQATYPGTRRAQRVEIFSTTTDLRDWLQNTLAGPSVNAVYHSAAVCDYAFGKIWLRSSHGDLTEVKAGKIGTAQGTLLAELVPTPKIISGLRDWFPKARIIGWKYEVDGNRAGVVGAALKQISECLTDACVANGPAYGEGFALVGRDGRSPHVADAAALYTILERLSK